MALDGLRLIVILTEGIRGHLNQSRGVARQLARRTGAEIAELEVPDLRGLARLRSRSAARRMLRFGNRRSARDWLAQSDGEALTRKLGAMLSDRDIHAGETTRLILMSAGSTPALYCIALGFIWRCTCVTIMTPSTVGTEPFDFAIVPEHDYPRASSNVMTTIGAPNLIVRGELDEEADALLAAHPPKREERWGVLIGGDDKNYRISGDWVQANLGRIFREAERADADLYITTSRRTSREAEAAVRRLANSSDRTRFLLLASEDPTNPVPAMLGACDEIFVTDDSVNMVSEAATAGHRAVLLRAGRAGGIRGAVQRAFARLASMGLAPRRLVWGVPRFDATIERFKEMGLLIEWSAWTRERIRESLSEDDAPRYDEREDFNEARRAAEWILGEIGSVYHPAERE